MSGPLTVELPSTSGMASTGADSANTMTTSSSGGRQVEGSASSPMLPSSLGAPGTSGMERQNSGGSHPGSPMSPLSPDPVHDLPPELLQAGWRKFWSRREGRPYYFNKVTNESLWETPTLALLVSA